MIFLDRLCSMRSRVKRVRRLVIEVIVVVEYFCIVRDPSY